MKDFSKRYPVWFCDIWGVLHNGYQPFAETINALTQHRTHGGTVVLVSNSPRSTKGVALQLDQIGVERESYDDIVTSGDVTQSLMLERGGAKLFHIGAERDISLFQGLPVERVPLEQATAVICTGLYHDEQETPEDYVQLLAEIKQRNLLMICANPDKVVRKGDRLLYCAGALAEAYQAIGGKVVMAGKPYAPIYELARAKATAVRKALVDTAQILAIGDGPETDILGAANQGFACVYVSGGVRDHVEDLASEEADLRRKVPGVNIVRSVARLDWV